ncbi:ATP-dependent RNA helicase DDX24, partial [Atheta coriaria]|uniref:ATP-dependent RNA helicase DDX24 n=1 Tax=Dalotia coriaria TaxID=877792 RepID=UPI0031F38939
MVKRKQKNLWKPVEIEGSLLDNGLDLDGLIGIEECHDYDLQDFLPTESNEQSQPKKGQATQKKTKIKKNKAINVQDGDSTPSKCGATSIAGDFQVEQVPQENLANDETVDFKAWQIVPLHEKLLKGLIDLKFQYPTEIQQLTLPAAILGKRDILGAAETGSGKTLAFGLPILEGILKHEQSNEKLLHALILAPTRELAIQIRNHLVAVAKHTQIKIAVIVGGLASAKQERVLKSSPEIVVATPGRLWELIQQGNEHLSQLEEIKYLAIDETDRMLERGHFNELELILEKINMNERNRQRRQNFVFSATLTMIHELPAHVLMKKKLKAKRRIDNLTPMDKLKKVVDSLGITNPKVVDITQQSKGKAQNLTECRITCDIDEKDYYVYYFLQRHPGRTLIFCNSIGCVKRLTTLLGLLGCEPMALHASMQQRQRLKNLDRFRDREDSVLIATDVAARGLDIPAVQHVLHYQTPRTAEGYVHRSGRTARASSEGIAVLLVETGELQNYLRLCRTLGKTEDLPSFPVQEHYLNAVKQRVNLARQVDKLDLQVRKANAESGWYEKAAEEMDIIIDNPSLKYDLDEAHGLKKSAQVRRKQLTAMLAKPIFPTGLISGKYPLS